MPGHGHFGGGHRGGHGHGHGYGHGHGFGGHRGGHGGHGGHGPRWYKKQQRMRARAPMHQPVHHQPAPVHHQPAPVYQQPAPVYQQPAPVYQQPAPVYHQPAPVHVQPAAPQVVQQPAPVHVQPAAPQVVQQPVQPVQPVYAPEPVVDYNPEQQQAYEAEIAANDAAIEDQLESEAKSKAVEVARELRAAMAGWGTNEGRMIKALAGETNRTLYHTIAAYAEEFKGRDLLKDIKDETGGNFERALLSLFEKQAVVDAKNLKGAFKGLGTDEERMDEVLLFRSPKELRDVKAAYLELTGNKLEKSIKSETSGNLEKLYLAALNEKEEHDPTEVEEDVQALYDAGQGKLGTDEEEFVELLASSDAKHVTAINEVYIQTHGKTIEQVIDSEFGGGSTKKALINIARGYPTFIAKRLLKSMDRVGTDDKMLVRLLFSHRESGVLKDASRVILEKTGRNLIKWIKDETRGDYEDLLVAVVQAWGC